LLDGRANTLICPAPAYVAGHGVIDGGIVRMRITSQKGGRRHDLTGLAIAALHYFKIQPRVLNLFTSWGIPDRFDRRDCRVPDALDGSYARACRLTVEMDGTRTTQCHAASKLGSGQAEDVAQHPKQWGVTVNIDFVIHSVDFDCVGHGYPRDFPRKPGGIRFARKTPLHSAFLFASFITFAAARLRDNVGSVTALAAIWRK
jgi:hypothetical protein